MVPGYTWRKCKPQEANQYEITKKYVQIRKVVWIEANRHDHDIR